MIQTILTGLIVFVSGILGGIVYTNISPSQNTIFPISREQHGELTQSEAIGFMPYWLLNYAKESYKDSLTNLSYFSLTIDKDGHIQKKVNPQEEEPGWTTLKKESVRKLLNKAKIDGFTTSLTVFAANEQHIDALLSNPVEHANNLLADIMPLMKEFSFNDLNLDIESTIEATESSQMQFTQFTHTLKEGLVWNNLGTLTVDMTVMSLFQNQRMDPKDIGVVADRVVLMTYDYHYAGSHVSGPASPISGSGFERFNDAELSVRKALEVVPPEKLLLGIPLYGYEWETLRADPGASVIPGTGKTASNRRVQEILKGCTNCITGRDTTGDEPYVVFPHGSYYHHIYYTDALSLQRKHAFAKEMGLAGVAYWAIGYEGNVNIPSFSSSTTSVSF